MSPATAAAIFESLRALAAITTNMVAAYRSNRRASR
jgi:hypothetical protein